MEYNIVKNALDHIAAHGANGTLATLNVTDQDFAALRCSHPWTADQRNSIVGTFRTIRDASLIMLGLPESEPPAEYTAACIAALVCPNKWRVAAQWIAGKPIQTAGSLAAGDVEGVEAATASQIVGMIYELDADHVNKSARALATHLGYELQAAKAPTKSAKSGKASKAKKSK